MIAVAVIGLSFGCSKNSDVTTASPDEANVAGLQQAYDDSKIYNDSLMKCTNNASQYSDSAHYYEAIHHFDHSYHHCDSMFSHYMNLCNQQMNSQHHGHMINGGTMGNNMNYNKMLSDYGELMASLHQVHSPYHPNN